MIAEVDSRVQEIAVLYQGEMSVSEFLAINLERAILYVDPVRFIADGIAEGLSEHAKAAFTADSAEERIYHGTYLLTSIGMMAIGAKVLKGKISRWSGLYGLSGGSHARRASH